MKPILQNLAEMTAHRDHLRLEVSVLSTLLKLGHIVQVRALELFTQDEVLQFRNCICSLTQVHRRWYYEGYSWDK